MQEVINIFTIIGSILGIIGFITSFITPLHTHNKEKWKEISSIIKVRELEDMRDQLSCGRIDVELYNKYKYLINMISSNDDIINLKSIYNNKIIKKFSLILELDKELRKEIQVPRWEPKPKGIDRIEIDKDYLLNKYENYEDYDCEINRILENVYSISNELVVNYKEIERLANRLPHEYVIMKK